jgi:hypothetical protein
VPELRSYEEVPMQHLGAVQAGLRRGARSLAAAPLAFLPLMLAGGCGVPEGRDGVEDIDALRLLKG